MSAQPVIDARGLRKSFTLHAQGETLPVLHGLSLAVWPGECVVLDGASGAGKSTLMRILYGNYKVDAGTVGVRHDGVLVDLATAPPRLVLALRRHTLGHVSQFLRVIPRVPALDLVAEKLLAVGVAGDEARDRAREMLRLVALPARLWGLPPATFSGGEQQRVNIARGLVAAHPILLVDEPTASLDAENGTRVTGLLCAAREAGTAIVAICHDAAARAVLATRLFPISVPDAAA